MPLRALIVDDNQEVRSVLRAFLENQDVVVCGEAANGLAAIASAERLNPDLILLDLAMPVMNGVEAASVLRSKLPRVCIVLFTMYTDAVSRALATTVGVDLVVAKSDGLTALTMSLEPWIARAASAGGSGSPA